MDCVFVNALKHEAIADLQKVICRAILRTEALESKSLRN